MNTIDSAEKVCAVVVTYNRKELLRECLLALQYQQRRVDTILVVENASTDGTLELLTEEFPEIEVLALQTNGGGAGGFHAGMKHAYDQGFDWIWLMDDDGKPAPNCLQSLLDHSQTSPKPAVILPVQKDNLGRFYGIDLQGRNMAGDLVAGGKERTSNFLFTFVGPLISRTVIERVGLPIKEFFIWLDDFEYALRIHKYTNLPILAVPSALFFHDPGGVIKEVSVMGRRSLRAQQPAWKIYYGSRNGLYIISRAHPAPRALVPFFFKETKLLIGDLIYEPERWNRVSMRLRGLCDGALGRLGKLT